MLTIVPRLSADEESLFASTSIVVLVLTLALKRRDVCVNRASRTITVRDRIVWFRTKVKVISFDEISAVTYGYEEFFELYSARDPIDRFVVGLRMKSGAELGLFSFYGDGAFTNESVLPDWWYWDEFLFDYTGPQQQTSRHFANLLTQMLKVTLIPSTLAG